MRLSVRSLLFPVASIAAVALAAGTLTLAAKTSEAPFMRENDAAMSKMMAAMHIRGSGDVDADFVAIMVPYHQGAIDMAKVELAHGKDPELRKMAEKIIADQEKEIAEMQAWLKKNAK